MFLFLQLITNIVRGLLLILMINTCITIGRRKPRHKESGRKYKNQLVKGFKKIYNKKYLGNDNIQIFPKSMAYNTSSPVDVPTYFRPFNIDQSVKSTLILGEKRSSECGKAPISNNIWDTTTCPWYYDLIYDELMIPTSIWHARCRCPQCGRNGTCQEVFVPTPVLKGRQRRKGRKIKISWRPTIINISVACVCKENIDI